MTATARRFWPALFLIVYTVAGGTAWASNGECNDEIVVAVGMHFGLANFYYPYPNSDGKLIDGQCKSLPTDTEKTVAAFIYDNESPKKGFWLPYSAPATTRWSLPIAVGCGKKIQLREYREEP